MANGEQKAVTWIGLGISLFFVFLAIGSAWVDVKSDIAVMMNNQKNDESNNGDVKQTTKEIQNALLIISNQNGALKAQMEDLQRNIQTQQQNNKR